MRKRHGRDLEMQPMMAPLHVFSHCNEIQNFPLWLWVKASFSNAWTKGKVHLNSGRECLLQSHAFLAPVFSPGGKISWSRQQLSSPPGIPMLREGRSYSEVLRAPGQLVMRVTQESRPATCPPPPYKLGGLKLRGIWVWGRQQGEATKREQKNKERSRKHRPASHPRFPANCREVSGAPSYLYPFCVKITSRKVPVSNVHRSDLWSQWNAHA